MPTCYETLSCPISAPWELGIGPYQLWLGDYFVLIVWGLILAVTYLSNKDPMLTGIIGLIVTSAFIGTSAYTSSATQILFQKGYLILILAIGSSLFFLFRHKANNPGY